jgi:FkbM family methyltransferase
MVQTLLFDRLLLIFRYKSINKCLLRIVFAKSSNELVFLTKFPISKQLPCILQNSQGQFFQDLMALYYSNFKRDGYFVEIGLGDGKSSSNTYLLEKEYNWRGIVVEPNKSQHEKITYNRSSNFCKKLVYSHSGLKLQFNETKLALLSTIDSFSQSDGHAINRIHENSIRKYSIETISLSDLLALYKSPKHIDYLSLDTEGSELKILSTFDFNLYKIRVISVEHNFTGNRSRIFELLSSNGYVRVNDDVSNVDDWYISREL